MSPCDGPHILDFSAAISLTATKQSWDSRCIIDYQMYRMFHNHAEAFKFSACRVVSFDKWPQQIEAITAELDQISTMLLPPGIHGFFLKDKKWGTCKVPGLCLRYYLTMLTH